MPMEKVMCLKDRCKRCDIGYLVKDYLLPIMQAMTVQITDYNMRMIDTKCLNTSVMFFNLFFGKQASKYTKYCDVQNVIRRRTNQIDDSTAISKNLCDDILRKTKYTYFNRGYAERDYITKTYFTVDSFFVNDKNLLVRHVRYEDNKKNKDEKYYYDDKTNLKKVVSECFADEKKTSMTRMYKYYK